MIVKGLVVGPIAANCFIIGDEETKDGAIIDPGDESWTILNAVEDLGLEIRYIIATHGHFDHNAGTAGLKEKLDAPFLIHRDDLKFVQRSVKSAAKWGITIDQVPDPDQFIGEGDVLKLGGLELEVVHTPGHSPGGISLYIESENVVFSGDTLFQGSIGRTDFEGGSMAILARSIREKLYALPDSTIVYSGHGPPTTIGEEKMYNMFVR
jgi:glyoxylase-like metal-dependent hydrolase (beta-lactamase superfamily II)